jgi:hypothetical protein
MKIYYYKVNIVFPLHKVDQWYASVAAKTKEGGYNRLKRAVEQGGEYGTVAKIALTTKENYKRGKNHDAGLNEALLAESSEHTCIF